MNARILSSIVLALLACTPATSASADDAAPASARAGQDFSWSGTVKPGGEVRLAGVAGDVEVVTGSGQNIRVRATISGPDADTTKVVVDASGGNVKIHTDSKRRAHDVRVEYRIEMPENARFDAKVVSGDIDVRGVRGALELETVSGNIVARGSTDVRLESVSGNVEAVLDKKASRAMLEAVSGNLQITVPASVGLDLTATSLNGAIDAEPEHERRNQMVGSEIRISRGDRAAKVRLNSVNGGIRIRNG